MKDLVKLYGATPTGRWSSSEPEFQDPRYSHRSVAREPLSLDIDFAELELRVLATMDDEDLKQIRREENRRERRRRKR